MIARFVLHILAAINYKYHDFDVNKSKRDDYDHYRTIFESDLVFSLTPGWRVALPPLTAHSAMPVSDAQIR